MKTFYIKHLLLLVTTITLCQSRLPAQAFVNANNPGSGVFITIADTDIYPGGAVKIGTPATAAGFVGAGPGQVSLRLYAAPDSEHLTASQLANTTPIWTGFNFSLTLSLFQGCVSPGNPFVLPTQPGFDGTQLVDFMFYGITSGPYYISGYSTIGVIQPLTPAEADAGGLPPPIWGNNSGGTGISSMVLDLPEPSTIVIGGLGAVVLWALRRRK